MSLLLQLIVLILIFYVAYNKLGKDVFSPTVLLSIGYIITTTFAIYNLQRWKSDISLVAVLIVLMGVLFFFLTEIFWKRVRIKGKSDSAYVVPEQLKQINESKYNIKLIIAVVIAVVATVVLYREITRIAYSNYRDWGNLIYNYRQNRSEEQINIIARIANYLTKAFAYVYLFCFINKITESKRTLKWRIAKNIPLLIPGILYSAQTLLLGARIGIISFGVAGIFMYNLLMQYKYGKSIHVNIIKFIKGVILFIIICVLFFKVQEFIGRDQSKMSILDYVATYLGGSMDLFSQYIKNPNGYNMGHETFAGIISNLQSYMGILKNVKVTTSHEFRVARTGFIIGNTYTGFRNYYNDFGFVGGILAIILFASIFTSIYYMIKKIRKLNRFLVATIVIFASEIYCVLFHFFCDYFLAGISVNRAINYLLIIVVCIFVFDKKMITVEKC